MSNIQKFNPKQDNPLFLPNILTQHENEIFQTVAAAIAKSFADTGTAVPDTQHNDYLVNEVTDSVLNNFPSIRMVEIPMAFAAGIRGGYGKYFGLTVVSFEQFLTGYLHSEERKKLIEEKYRQEAASVKEPDKSEKFRVATEMAIKAMENYRQKGSIGIIALTVYTFLNGLKLIHKDYKAGIMQSAIQMNLHEKKIELTYCTDPLKRRRLHSELQLLEENLKRDLITQDQHSDIQRTAKRLALERYFQACITEETDLSQLIDQKKEIYLNT